MKVSVIIIIIAVDRYRCIVVRTQIQLDRSGALLVLKMSLLLNSWGDLGVVHKAELQHTIDGFFILNFLKLIFFELFSNHIFYDLLF